jgi:L,D-peptidoglycan transpeptidase YkuD (ErfK/YbiS/YcfS/YnhG family)
MDKLTAVRFLTTLLLLIFATSIIAQSQKTLSDFALQAVVVTTRDWSNVQGNARLFERKSLKSNWKPVGKSFPIVVGKNGLGWSDKSYPEKRDMTAATANPYKHECDGKSPAGVFSLTAAFGSSEQKVNLPFTELTESTECVDDSKSKEYNKIVDNKQVAVDWSSSEKMLSVGEQYASGIFVAHNSEQKELGGSCIFLHIWKDNSTGTAGCTAMEKSNIERIFNWIDAKKKPVLIQMSADWYQTYQKLWKLPKLKP